MYCLSITLISFSFILAGVLPKYFSSEWSVAQFRLPEGYQYIVAFGHQKNTVVILGLDGRSVSINSLSLEVFIFPVYKQLLGYCVNCHRPGLPESQASDRIDPILLSNGINKLAEVWLDWLTCWILQAWF